MYPRIMAPLLLVIAACAPHAAVQSPPAPALGTASQSNDATPWHFCLVGTKDCAAVNEFTTCLLSTGRCNADAHIEYASSEMRLKLEPSVARGANPEIVLPVER